MLRALALEAPRAPGTPILTRRRGWQGGIGGTRLWAFREMESALSTFPSFVIVPSLSHVRLFSTPWMQHTRLPCFYYLQSLIKLMSTESRMPSNQHIVCCLQSFPASGSVPMSQLFTSVAKVLELQLQHQSFQRVFRFISFRIDWFDLLAVQGPLNNLLQHHSSKASILLCSAFFMVHLSHPSIHDYWKTHSFDYT